MKTTCKLLASAAFLGALPMSGGCLSYEGDLFWISRNKADMPVWVRGNTDSGVFIIHNHGGPGSSGLFEVYRESSPGDGSIDDVSPLLQLEEDYAVVYWDQRHQGNAQGNADPDETTWEDFGEDANLLTDVLNERHDVDDVFMIGQSWGQTVGTIYMTLGDGWEERQSKLTGYIDYKGNIAANQPYGFAAPKDIEIANEKIANGDNVDFYRDCLDLWETKEQLETPADFLRHSDCADTAMGGLISGGERIRTSVNGSFVSPHNGWFHWANVKSTSRSSFMNRLIQEAPLLETANRVNIPTLMIHGRRDLQAPPEVGQWYYNNIQTPEEAKELVILKESAHGAMGDDVEIFLDSIRGFIETYRTNPQGPSSRR